ncbi:MAG: hypothetical protein AAGF54_05535, partial [Pseudomonadota bacterium]
DFGVVDAFSVLSLFGSGEQGLLIDPSDKTSVFKDALGGTPAGTGYPLGAVSDLSGNDNHFIQSSESSRPALKTDGSFWWIEPDGIDDFMSISASAGSFNFLHDGTGGEIIAGVSFGEDDAPNACHMLLDNTDASLAGTGTSVFYDDRASFRRRNHVHHLVSKGDPSGENKAVKNAGFDNIIKAGTDGVIGVLHQSETQNDTAMMIDGYQIWSSANEAPISGDASDNLTLFKQSTSNESHMKGRLYFLLVIDRILTEEERSKLVAYIEQKMPRSALKVSLHSYDVGSRTEWFLDQSDIDCSSGINFDTQRPTKSPANPLCEPTGPNQATWDCDKYYPNIHLDNGTYKAWQGCWDNEGGFVGISYSTSSDGVNWAKPDIGLETFRGSRSNNLLHDAYDPTVIWDGTRYVIMLGIDIGAGTEGVTDGSGHIYSSRDGINDFVLEKSFDQDFFAEFHGLSRRSDGRWITYYTRDHGICARKIGAYLSDTDDPAGNWVDQGNLEGLAGYAEEDQFYNFTATMINGVLYGIAARFDDLSERHWMDIYTSPGGDGLNWTPQKGVWIPNGRYGEYDGGMANGKQLTHDGTELRAYYFGSVKDHIEALPRDARLCYATISSGRLAKLQGAGGTITTKAITANDELRINASSTGANLSIELLDPSDDSVLPGFAKADCDNLDGDHKDKTVTWNGISIPTTRPVKIKFYLDA